MRTLVKHNTDWINDVFEDLFGREGIHAPAMQPMHRPATNVREEEDSFHLEVLTPGFAREDVSIHLDDDVLTISSSHEETQEDEQNGYAKREFVKRSFKRMFRLPETVDQDGISATMEDGILHLTLPKKEEAKPTPARTIEIG